MDGIVAIVLDRLKTLPGVEGKGPIEADDDLIAGGLLNSLAILDLVSFVEQRFAVSLPIEEFIPENFRSASAIADLARRLSRRAS